MLITNGICSAGFFLVVVKIPSLMQEPSLQLNSSWVHELQIKNDWLGCHIFLNTALVI